MKLDDIYLGDIITFSQKNEYVSGIFDIENNNTTLLLGDLTYLIEFNNEVVSLYTPVNGLPNGINLGVESSSGELIFMPSNMIYFNSNLPIVKYRKISFYDKKRFAYILYLDSQIITFIYHAHLYEDDLSHTKIKRGSVIKKAVEVSSELIQTPIKLNI